MNVSYESYAHWRSVMTDEAGLSLTADYCRERIEALTDEKDASTKAFVDAYGNEHRNQVVTWFEQAMAEA